MSGTKQKQPHNNFNRLRDKKYLFYVIKKDFYISTLKRNPPLCDCAYAYDPSKCSGPKMSSRSKYTPGDPTSPSDGRYTRSQTPKSAFLNYFSTES